MRKMPCLFQRDFTDPRKPILLSAVTPGCEWVLEGRGFASAKLDGTACAIIDGRLYARYDAKHGKTPPPDGIPCDPAPDPKTGHWPHWIPVGDQPHLRWHVEAWVRAASGRQAAPDGTYELIGPKVSGNPHGVGQHVLEPHGKLVLHDAPRSFDRLGVYLRDLPYEGIVFRDGDAFAKIRRADFGHPWPRLSCAASSS